MKISMRDGSIFHVPEIYLRAIALRNLKFDPLEFPAIVARYFDQTEKSGTIPWDGDDWANTEKFLPTSHKRDHANYAVHLMYMFYRHAILPLIMAKEYKEEGKPIRIYGYDGLCSLVDGTSKKKELNERGSNFS